MPLSDIVQITITSGTVAVKQAGYGVPLILSANASWVDRLRYYTDTEGMVTDGFASNTPEYRAASAMFAQSPAPTRVAVGKLLNKPTQKYLLEVTTVRNSYVYSVKVSGTGFTDTTLTFTSDASATNDEIIAGLLAALNGVSGKNYTAAEVGSVGTKDLEVTGNAAGNWFSVEVVNVDDLKISQTHADPGAAADLDAIKLYNSDWYGIYNAYNSNAMALAIAAWTETNKKFYAAGVNDSESVTLAAGGSDTLDDFKTSAYSRTAGMYHPSPANFADAAWLGKCLPLDPGSETWMFKTLNGVAAVPLTATHIANLKAKNANSYYSVAGVNITFDGKVAANEYIDIVRFRDWLEARMSERVFGTLAAATKVPYDDTGIGVIENDVRGVLAEGVTVGGLAKNPAPVVTVPKASEATSADKTARLLRNVKFSATYAGAIHKVLVTGVISV